MALLLVSWRRQDGRNRFVFDTYKYIHIKTRVQYTMHALIVASIMCRIGTTADPCAAGRNYLALNGDNQQKLLGLAKAIGSVPDTFGLSRFPFARKCKYMESITNESGGCAVLFTDSEEGRSTTLQI